MSNFTNIRNDGVQKVANAAARLLLLPPDGYLVEQLDDNTIWAWNQASQTWIATGGTDLVTSVFGRIGDVVAQTGDYTAAQVGAVALTGDESVSGIKSFTSYPEGPGTSPTTDAQLVDKAYVDLLVTTGARFVDAVLVATTTPLPANTYNNGVSGVGATLTGNVNGALAAIDGVTPLLNGKYLIKDEATQANNGAYLLTQVGDGSNPYILTRLNDYNESSEIVGGTFFTVIGGSQANQQWAMNNAATITVGTTAITFAQLSVAPTITASLGVQKVGNDVRANLDAAGAITLSGNSMLVNVDNASIERNANALRVKALGVTNAMLAGSIADSKLSTITTAGKVRGSALTILSGIPGAAGVIPVANGSTGNSSYAIGDILYATGATTLSKLGIGSNGKVLGVTAGLPSWVDQTGGGGGGLSTIYYSKSLSTDSTQVTVSNSVTETTLYTYSIPANQLGTDKVLEGLVEGTYLNNSAANRTVRVRVKYGATTILDKTSGNLGTSATSGTFSINFYLANQGANNVQQAYMYCSFESGANVSVDFTDRGVAAIDSTTTQSLVVTVALTNATATQTITKRLATLNMLNAQDDVGGVLLQTDGVDNGLQTTLNLAAGTGINLTDNGTGTVTIDSTGGVVFGDPASGFVNGEIQYIDQSGNQFGDTQFTRDSSTKYTNIKRDFTSSDTVYTADVGIGLVSGPITGTFTVGETVNDVTSGASGVFEYTVSIGGSDLIVLSAYSGSFNNSDNLLGSSSGATAQVAQGFAPTFTIGETVYIIDPGTGIPTAQGLVTNITGPTVEFTATGTVNLNDIILDIPGTPTKLGGMYTLSSASVPVNLNTGFTTDNNYAGVGLEGSYMHIDDNVTSMDFGVFDLTPFGGSRTSAGIVSLGLSGSVVSFAVSPAGSNGSVAATVQNAANDATNLAVIAEGFGLTTALSGGNPSGVQSDGTHVQWVANGNTYNLPTSLPSANDVMYVSGVSGNNVDLDFTAPSGGGGSVGSIYEVQTSDGAGGFRSSSNFQFNDTSNEILVTASNSIYADNSNNYKFGNFGGLTTNFYTDLNSNGFNVYNTHSAASIVFAGSGLDNLTAGVSSYSSASVYTYILTIDSQNNFSGAFFTGAGLDDMTVGSYSGENDSWRVKHWGEAQVTTGVDPVTGTPQPLEQFIGQSSGATFKFIKYDAAASGTIYVVDLVGTPTVSETFQNAGASASFVLANAFSASGIDAFNWVDRRDNSTGTDLITGSAQAIGTSPTQVNVTFAATIGHTSQDYYDFGYGGAISYGTTSESGLFTTGEVVTGSISGSTAIVANSEFSSFHYIALYNMSAPFVAGEVLTGSTSGQTCTTTGLSSYSFVNNTYNWYDGTNNHPNTLLSDLVGYQSNQSAYFIWATSVGHNVGDQWNVQVTPTIAPKLSISSNQIVSLGDVNGSQTGLKFDLDISGGNSILKVPGIFEVQYPGAAGLLRVEHAPNKAVFNGDYAGITNGFFTKTDVDAKSWLMNISGTEYVSFDANNQMYRLGIAAGNNLILDSANQRLAVSLGGVAEELLIDKPNGLARFGGINTNEGNLKIDDNSKTVELTANNGGTPTGLVIDGTDKVNTYKGGKIESNIRTLAYNTFHGLNHDDYVLFFSGGTAGSSTVGLNANFEFPIGTVLIVKDGDGVAATDNITIDAGTGNTISGTSVAQTFVMNTNGQAVTVRRISSTQWMTE